MATNELGTKGVQEYDPTCEDVLLSPPHPVKDIHVYRFWSTVSRSNGSYLKRNSPTAVRCNGTDKPSDLTLTLVTAYEVKLNSDRILFRFSFPNTTNPLNHYVITGGAEGSEVYLQDVPINQQPPYDNKSIFEPEYFYSSTLFRCYDAAIDGRNDLYIGSDVDGITTMVKRGLKEYPNPAVLFRLFVPV